MGTSGHTSCFSSESYLLIMYLATPFLCHPFTCQAFREHSVTSVQLCCHIKMAARIHSLKMQKCEGGDNSFSGREKAKTLSFQI